MEQPIVSAVTHAEDEVLFDLRGLPDRPGRRHHLRGDRGRAPASTRSSRTSGTNSAELSFSVPQEDVSATRRALDQAQQSIGPIARSTKSRTSRKISLVGADVQSHRESRRECSALAEQEINLRLISTSPIKVACLIGVATSTCGRALRGVSTR